MANVYGVFDGEKMIFSGTASEIVKEYDLYDRMTVYNYVNNNWLLHRKYKVKFLRKAARHINEEPKPTKAEKERQEHLDNIIAMLKLYGATFVRDRDEWRNDLRKAGIKYRSKKWENGYRLETYE